MTDPFVYALETTKNSSSFDLNYAFICAQLSYQSYNTASDQIQYLSGYGFTNIKVVTVQNAVATLACYSDDLYIVFMGTVFSNIQDVINDADILWTKEGIGQVHSGYKDHLDLLWSDVQSYVNSTPHKQVIITGHSMGGACGQIANSRLPNAIVYSFGSPRAVDSKIKNSLKVSAYHIQHDYDLVPKLPPAPFGFRILGDIYTLKNETMILKPAKWTDAIYSVFYTIAYFIMLGYTKCFGNTDHLSNLLVSEHEISGYFNDIQTMVCSCLQANQQ